VFCKGGGGYTKNKKYKKKYHHQTNYYYYLMEISVMINKSALDACPRFIIHIALSNEILG
jgi:hypothetical protein